MILSPSLNSSSTFLTPNSFFNYKRSKLKLRAFLAGHILAMVTYCATNLTATCLPMIGQFCDTIIIWASPDSGFNDPSHSTSWKVLETVLSHLKLTKMHLL